MIALGVLGALLIGALLGGRVGRLGALRARWWWIAPLAFAAEMGAVYSPWRLPDAMAAAVFVGAGAALVAVGLANARLPGAPLAALGIALNLAVMAANGGFMPIAPETLVRAGHAEPWRAGDMSPGTRVAMSKDAVQLPEDARLEPLSDRYVITLPGGRVSVFSIGDVLLTLGVGFLVVRTMTAPDPLLHYRANFA